MKVNEMFHIDVTEEEGKLFADKTDEHISKKQTTSKYMFKKTFLIVTGVHIAVLVGAACLAGPLFTSSASEIKYAGVEQTVGNQAEQAQADAEFTKPQATPEPTPKSTPAPTPTPKSTPAPTPTPKSKQTNLVKSYVVKQGDTVYSIAKKYKLNTKRLLEINGIKDQNKIVVGHTLKFM